MSSGQETSISKLLKEETLVELLKEKLVEGRSLFSDAVKTILVFLAITGVLANLSVGAVGGARNVLFFASIGIATSIFFVLVCWTQRLIRRAMSEDIGRLNESLHHPLKHEDLPALKYLTLTSLWFGVMVGACWLILVFIYSLGKVT